MMISGWRRTLALGAMCSTLALGACATDPITGSIPQEPQLSPDEQPAAAAQRLTRLGDSARASGDPRTAIMFYRRALDLQPKDYPVMIRLAGALNEAGAHKEAIDIYQHALEFSPRDPEALRGLGLAVLARNQPILAREQFTTALEVSDDPRLYSALGVTLDMTGDHESAQSYYRMGLEHSPDSLSLMTNLALSLALDKRFGDAINLMRQVVTNPNSNRRHRQNLALIYGLAGRMAEAERVAAMDMQPATVAENLAYYETLRALPDPEKYLLNPRRNPITIPEAAPVNPNGVSESDSGTATTTNTAVLAPAPRPAPAISAESVRAAATPAALPPVGPMQIEDPVSRILEAPLGDTDDAAGMSGGASTIASDTLSEQTQIVEPASELANQTLAAAPAANTEPAGLDDVLLVVDTSMADDPQDDPNAPPVTMRVGRSLDGDGGLLSSLLVRTKSE